MRLFKIENTSQKSIKLKLGKNKLPPVLEESIIKLKQGDRKLFVLSGNQVKSYYPNNVNSNTPVFFDISILRVIKNF